MVEPALRHLAFWLFTGAPAQAAVTEHELIAETARFFHGRGFESGEQAGDAAREFVSFCRGRAWVFSDAGTTAAGDPLYSFTHRTFLEYFAAAYLAVTHDRPEALARTIAPHIARQEWQVVADLAVQIKDRATDRGAERIIATLLSDRRHTSLTSRSHILEFLAHSLRSVSPPPQTVRDLRRHILGHTFSGDPDGQPRCHPLHHLIIGCASARDIVQEEIFEKARALVESADPVVSMNGLRLAVWVDDRNIQTQSSRAGIWDDRLWELWHEAAINNVASYSSALISAAGYSTVMKYTAVVRELITVEQVLAEAQPKLEVLFNSQPTLFGIVGAPHLFRQVYDLIRGRRWYRDRDPRLDFHAYGGYVAEHPDPPFVTNPTGYGNFLATLGSPAEGIALADTRTLLGASLALAIGAEASQELTLRRQDHHALGPLNDLYPYLARRFGIEPGIRLPELQFPRAFAGLFTSWANKDVNFVSQTVA